MIHRIFSSLDNFKELKLKPGLNILLAQKEIGASEKQTRNRAGKTSLIEIINFLTGSKMEKDSLFSSSALVNESFGMEFFLGGENLIVERSGQKKSKVHLESAHFLGGKTSFSNAEWIRMLGDKMFGLRQLIGEGGRVPTFRSLFGYFARRQISGAFTTPEKHATKQQTGDYQIALMFLLGLDWKIASKWQKVRDREKVFRELKRAVTTGAFSKIIGKVSDLRTQTAVAEARLQELKSALDKFRVLPQYRELEAEANQLTRSLNELTNANIIDLASIRNLEHAMQVEAPPPLEDLERLYAEAGVALPDMTVRRYEDVRSFHKSVIQNRRDYLASELEITRHRLAEREQERLRLDKRRAVVLEILRSHGALDQFTKLQEEVGRMEADVESLRQRFESAEQLEGAKNELEMERNHLTLQLRRDFTEQKRRLSEAILAFEEISKRLYVLFQNSVGFCNFLIFMILICHT